MKTTKLPQSEESDSQAAGSQMQQRYQDSYISAYQVPASNDTAYYMHRYDDEPTTDAASDIEQRQAYKKPKNQPIQRRATKSDAAHVNTQTMRPTATAQMLKNDTRMHPQLARNKANLSNTTQTGTLQIPERTFMNGLIKHTAIALAIIIPLAAFSAYAATPEVYEGMQSGFEPMQQYNSVAVRPDAILYNQSSTPTTVDSVDLEQYAGTWYEIGRLPMYFQRKCAGDVTATYTLNDADSSVGVLNKCKGSDGEVISADGIARVADDSGSKLKVTFLPTWLRWLPVGRADYWVLARDADYNTALVGTPDNKYLWLLARTPNVSADTYAKYRQIATEQGYDLSEFKLTTQSGQTVDLDK